MESLILQFKVHLCHSNGGKEINIKLGRITNLVRLQSLQNLLQTYNSLTFLPNKHFIQIKLIQAQSNQTEQAYNSFGCSCDQLLLLFCQPKCECPLPCENWNAIFSFKSLLGPRFYFHKYIKNCFNFGTSDTEKITLNRSNFCYLFAWHQESYIHTSEPQALTLSKKV